MGNITHMSEAPPHQRGRPGRTPRPVEDTRAAILGAALTLFSERGFEGAAMRDIAAKAGVEHSLLRYHFTDNLFLLGGYDDPLVADRRSIFLGGGVTWVDDDLKYLMGSLPLH